MDEQLRLTAAQFNQLRDDTSIYNALNSRPNIELLKKRVDEHMVTLGKELAAGSSASKIESNVFINAQPDNWQDSCKLTLRLGFGIQKSVTLYFDDHALMAEALHELAEFIWPSQMHQPVDEPVKREADFVWPNADLKAPMEPDYLHKQRKQAEVMEKNRQDHEELRRILGL